MTDVGILPPSIVSGVPPPATRTSPLRSLGRWRALEIALGGGAGLVVVIGYAVHFEPAWRPFRGLPATHPNSAIDIVLLAISMLAGALSKKAATRLVRGALLTVTIFLLLGLAGSLFGSGIIEILTPFKNVLADQAAEGRPITPMSTNTGCVLLAIAIAEIFRWSGHPAISQIFASISIGGIFVAVTDYLFGLPIFHATMAPITLLAALSLSFAALFATPGHGIMRVLSARSEAGNLARLMLGISTAVVLLFGWLVTQHIDGPGIDQPADSGLLVYQTAGIIVLIWVLVTVGMTRADRMDARRRVAEQSLIEAATTDALTGLLSRNRMAEIRTASRAEGAAMMAAKLFIDLDRFRSLNEAFGHEAGDELLREVARRLQSIAGNHHVGRVGGDEFAIYCAGITVEEAERIGHAVTASLAQPFNLEGHIYHLTASVGIAHTDTVGGIDLRQAADSAMFVAKHRGGNKAVSFALSMHDAVTQNVELEQELYEALGKKNDLTLVYQPVVRLIDGSLYAVETLARWTHPRLGPISPGRFVPIAEATGLIVPLGHKLMGLAIQQAAQWHGRYPERCPIININFSPLQFATGDVIGDFVRSLREHGLPTSRFCIEVTEGAFTDENAVRALREARHHGFRVAMDDFGVGYSSLSQLPRLPLTSVKLDRSFIVNATESVGDATMLSSLVRLAHDLGLCVVAEGVETEQQLSLVRDSGCDTVQGYILSRPLPPADFEIWISGEAPSRIVPGKPPTA